MSEIRCGSCSVVIKSREKTVISCTLCECKYHTKCVNFTEEDMRYLQDKRNLKFICNSCSNRNITNELKELKKMMEICMNTITQHSSQIEQQGKKMDTILKGEHSHINKENAVKDDRNTYANILKKNTTEAILIKPIDEGQGSNKTQEEVTCKIDPSKLGLHIENIKTISKGGIIVNCSNSDSRSKLKNKMEEELGNKYKVEYPKMKNPKIKIKGMETKFMDRDDKEVIKDIMDQNNIEEEGIDKLKILKKYEKKGRRNYGILIVEVEPILFKSLMEKGKLNAGWRQCGIEEYFSIVQCYKCARFNHLAKDCENNITCFKCSGNHKTDVCNSDNVKCINCIASTEKLKIKLDCNHTTFDQKCPCLIRQVEKIVSRTNYNI